MLASLIHPFYPDTNNLRPRTLSALSASPQRTSLPSSTLTSSLGSATTPARGPLSTKPACQRGRVHQDCRLRVGSSWPLEHTRAYATGLATHIFRGGCSRWPQPTGHVTTAGVTRLWPLDGVHPGLHPGWGSGLGCWDLAAGGSWDYLLLFVCCAEEPRGCGVLQRHVSHVCISTRLELFPQ